MIDFAHIGTGRIYSMRGSGTRIAMTQNDETVLQELRAIRRELADIKKILSRADDRGMKETAYQIQHNLGRVLQSSR